MDVVGQGKEKNPNSQSGGSGKLQARDEAREKRKPHGDRIITFKIHSEIFDSNAQNFRRRNGSAQLKESITTSESHFCDVRSDRQSVDAMMNYCS